MENYRSLTILCMLLGLCWPLDVKINTRSDVYLISNSRVTKLKFFHDMQLVSCFTFKNQQIFSYDNSTVNHITISEKDMDIIVTDCDVMRKLHLGTIVKKPKRMKRSFAVVYPGTKWCGIKNVATNYTDLGEHRETDKCCRNHDRCPKFIRTFEEKYGLFNFAIYTKAHCDCDDEFYNCLKQSGKTERTANVIGRLFFNSLEPECIREVTPSKVCVCKRLFGLLCCGYKVDDNRVVMEFVDNKRTF